MSCTWKIRLSLNKNQESRILKKILKNEKIAIFLSCKDLLFSLGNYVWDEKLSIVTPFEPDKFPFTSRPRITLHIGGKGKEKSPLEL